jgi:aerobic carbon-monoxide dehydrogenase large subunit
MAGADGTWNVTMDTPMGAQQMTLTLATNGNELSGKLGSPQGEMEFTGGTVDGDNLAWTVSIEQPMPMQIETTATVDGDTLTGESKLGAFGTAKLNGTRAS